MAEPKRIFVTGTSSGIGRDLALTMAARGVQVLAGVRTSEVAASLSDASSGALQPIICDIENPQSIEAALAQVGEAVGEHGLDGLVNNAGISINGPLELMPPAQFERQLRINVVSQLAVTQAFLPLLRKQRGRLVFMGSETGRVALPLIGGYAASKFALRAVADSLRLELRRFGIHVALIEPGSVKSEIWSKAIAAGTAHLKQDAALRETYARELRLLTALPRRSARTAASPARVTRATVHALTARFPRARYLVGGEAQVLTHLMALTPVRVSDAIIARAMRALGKRFAR